MCRLFGFRSVLQSQVHRSLVNADNALEGQSSRNPDGWGVAYYVGATPHIIKSDKAAIDDSIFRQVSGVVSSQTVLAHVRRGTLGDATILNTHPFQFGPWVFAHNGNIHNFHHLRNRILAGVMPQFRGFILGQTDSELIFFFMLSRLCVRFNLHSNNFPIEQLVDGVRATVDDLLKIIGPYSEHDDAGDKQTYLTFVLTNGPAMVAHQGGKNLFWSTHKQKCLDRDTCPKFAPACEAPSQTGFVNHMIITSEPLYDANVWTPMKPGQIIGVDASMRLLNWGR